MANAGRVSVVPKGNWQADIKYSRLDFVKYSSALYLAKKDVPLGTLPTDTDYWMFCGETDISEVANAINNIIDGTTTVGKAWKDSDGNFINTTYAKGVDLTDHTDASVTDTEGVHGFKVDAKDKKAYANIGGEWVEIAGGGGGSSSNTIFNITTTATSLKGNTVKLYTVDGTIITSSQFNDSLSCLISANIPIGNYYLLCDGFKYDISIVATGNTIPINFDEAIYPTPITFTVEGANEDNITITGNGITPINVIFGTSQTSKSVTMTLTPAINGKSFTFTSSVAKDTTDGTGNYTKEIVIDRDTTNVKCMPDGLVLYWYGNEITEVSGGFNYTDWNTIYGKNLIREKNRIMQKVKSNSTLSNYNAAIYTNNKMNLSNYTKIMSNKTSNIRTFVITSDDIKNSLMYGTNIYTTSNITSYNSGYIGTLVVGTDETQYLYALWLE